MNEPVLKIVDLVKHYSVHGSMFHKPEFVHAVDNVSFELFKSETFTIVGESGCGKTTLAKCLLRLIDADSGEIRLHGEDLLVLDEAALRPKRHAIQIVFQDPYASLDPRQTIYQVIATPLRLHGIGNSNERPERVAASPARNWKQQRAPGTRRRPPQAGRNRRRVHGSPPARIVRRPAPARSDRPGAGGGA